MRTQEDSSTVVKIDRAKSSEEDATFHTADDDIYVNVGGNRKVVRHCLPTSQVTFCAQIFIIVIIDSLCIYKLSKEGIKSLLSDGDHFFPLRRKFNLLCNFEYNHWLHTRPADTN